MTIPSNGYIKAPGAHATFMRLPLSQISRTRYIEYPNGTSESVTRNFSKRARPLRAPRILVTGYVDKDTKEVVEGIEVYYATYTIYEPGEQSCDPKWYNAEEQGWVYDQGSTYEVTFRLVTKQGDQFKFNSTQNLPTDPGDGFGQGYGLQGGVVTQVLDGDCSDGNCGPQIGTAANRPCDPNEDAPPASSSGVVALGWQELDGFSDDVVGIQSSP